MIIVADLVSLSKRLGCKNVIFLTISLYINYNLGAKKNCLAGTF